MKRLVVLGLAIGLLTALAAPSLASPPNHAGRPLHATLTGPAEVPDGDPDGSGTAHLWLNQGQGTICWKVTTANIVAVTAAHIHVAAVEVAGPVVVPLVGLTGPGTSSGCEDVDPDLIKAIRQNPGAYYVNVHNAVHLTGAVRGQLSK